jgi:DNA repair protein RecO (recombination protein O)
MSTREDEAIVLDVQAQGESDRRVVLLTEGGERLFAYAPGAAASRRRFGAALQPGTRVRATTLVRREGALPLLQEALPLVEPPRPDPIETYYATTHVLELVSSFAKEGLADPRLFRLLARVLERLAVGDAPEPLCRYAEAWLLVLAGVAPSLDVCSATGEPLVGRPARVVPGQGAFLSDRAPGPGYDLGPAAREWLLAIRSLPPDNLDAPRPQAARELARALPGLIEDFTERPLRALAALRRLGEARPGGRDRSRPTGDRQPRGADEGEKDTP